MLFSPLQPQESSLAQLLRQALLRRLGEGQGFKGRQLLEGHAGVARDIWKRW